jgi:hypothetical protein
VNARIIDLTGQTFGRLTVIAFSHINERRYAVWTARCICGAVVAVPGMDLRSGNTQSCHCLQRDRASIAVAARHQRQRELRAALATA